MLSVSSSYTSPNWKNIEESVCNCTRECFLGCCEACSRNLLYKITWFYLTQSFELDSGCWIPMGVTEAWTWLVIWKRVEPISPDEVDRIFGVVNFITHCLYTCPSWLIKSSVVMHVFFEEEDGFIGSERGAFWYLLKKPSLDGWEDCWLATVQGIGGNRISVILFRPDYSTGIGYSCQWSLVEPRHGYSSFILVHLDQQLLFLSTMVSFWSE